MANALSELGQRLVGLSISFTSFASFAALAEINYLVGVQEYAQSTTATSPKRRIP